MRPESQQLRPTTLFSRRCCYRSRSRANLSESKHTDERVSNVRVFACTPRATAARPHERKSKLNDIAYVARSYSTSYCQNDALTLAHFILDKRKQDADKGRKYSIKACGRDPRSRSNLHGEPYFVLFVSLSRPISKVLSQC